MRNYLAVGLLTPAIWILALLLLSGTDWFMSHDAYPALRSIGYGVRAQGQNCQVVLYGDSSALTGLDPRAVSNVTGLTACNVSEGLTVQEVIGSDAPLRAYLSQNEAPLIIVGMWSYTQLRPDVPPYTAYSTEGELYAARYGRSHFLLGMLLHPDWTMQFASWATEHVRPWRSRGVDARAERDAALGIYPFPLSPESTCTRNTLSEGPEKIKAWPESISAFRQKYTTPLTKVLVDISPVPQCSKYVGIYRERNAGLSDNPLLAVPIRYFNEGDVHFSPEGSRFISEQVGQQINAALNPNCPPHFALTPPIRAAFPMTLTATTSSWRTHR